MNNVVMMRPRLADAMDPIQYAYSNLLEHTGDLMDLAMKGPITRQQTALLVHLAQAMAERCDVVKQLAETRLEGFVLKEGA